MMLLRRRHEILRFNIIELILSVMTELSNLLIGKTLKISIFVMLHCPSSSPPLAKFGTGLISIAAPVECGMGRAVAPAPPLDPPGHGTCCFQRTGDTYYDLSVQRATWLIRRAAH